MSSQAKTRESFSTLNEDDENSLSVIAKKIAANSTVLDLGAGPGILGHHLSEKKGCTVDGVDIDPRNAKLAQRWYRNFHVADLEVANLKGLFRRCKYDYIVCADVLEHVRDPEKIVKQLAQLINRNGRLVLSIPNVGYSGLLAELLSGDFRYRDLGLLDRTHVRFFTRASLLRFMKKSGLNPIEIRPVRKHPSASEFDDFLNTFPLDLQHYIMGQPDAQVYQFIVEANFSKEYAKSRSSATHSAPFTQDFVCQLYWRNSKIGYSEPQSVKSQVSLGEGRERVCFALPLKCKIETLRLDPVDRPMILNIHSMRVLDNRGEKIWRWDGNRSSLERSPSHNFSVLQQASPGTGVTAVLSGRDPWLEVPVEKKTVAKLSEGGTFEVEFSHPVPEAGLLSRGSSKAIATDQSTPPGLLEGVLAQVEIQHRKLVGELADLRKINSELDSRIRQIFNSSSWKLTAPLRLSKAIYQDLFRYQKCPVRLVAGNQLESYGSDKYESLGKNSRFLIQPLNGRLPRGWLRISYKVTNAESYLRPVLCVNSSLKIPFKFQTEGSCQELAWIPEDVDELELRLIARAGKFTLKNFRIRRAGKLDLLFNALSQKSLNFRKTIEIVKSRDLDPINPILGEFLSYSRHETYQNWINEYSALKPQDIKEIKKHIRQLIWRPKISIVTPVYNTSEVFLRCMLNSVLDQIYPYWELCIADDASRARHVRRILKEFAQKDNRIKLVSRARNGNISAATNSALELATGEFVTLLDHDDELSPHALYMIAVELNRHPGANLLYTDEDKIDQRGMRYDPHFKPDWNPELFYAQNYISHLGVYRTSVVREIGGFRIGFEGSQDYDLALRVITHTDKKNIIHIPHILYHWRVKGNSRSFSSKNLTVAKNAAKRALSDYFASREEHVEIEDAFFTYHRVIYPSPDPWPKVSLIVPTRDRAALLKGCMDGLLHRTDYPNLEVIIVDNGSAEPATRRLFADLKRDSRVKILKFPGKFNFSAINNFAVSKAEGAVIGLINNDIDVIEPIWLKEMVRYAVRSNVGAVGAKLIFANETVQHGGVIIGVGGVAGHSHKHYPRHEAGYFSRLKLVQNLSGVTGACLIMRREIYQELGGLNEVNLRVAFNDVDLCLKIGEAGYDIVWTPYAELYHYESVSRGSDDRPEVIRRFQREIQFMQDTWGDKLKVDPYYSPNLTLVHEDFSLAFPPRVEKPWQEK